MYSIHLCRTFIVQWNPIDRIAKKLQKRNEKKNKNSSLLFRFFWLYYGEDSKKYFICILANYVITLYIVVAYLYHRHSFLWEMNFILYSSLVFLFFFHSNCVCIFFAIIRLFNIARCAPSHSHPFESKEFDLRSIIPHTHTDTSIRSIGIFIRFWSQVFLREYQNNEKKK